MATPEFLHGKMEQISLGEETTYGTPVAPVFMLARNPRFEPRLDQSWQEIRGAGAANINVTYEKGPRVVGGILNFAPQDWRWLKFVIGRGSTDVSDVNQGAYYSHTFTLNNLIKSFTMERGQLHTTKHVKTHEGCQVNAMTINWDAGGGPGAALMNVVLDLINEKEVEGSSITSLSAPTTAAFQFTNVKATLNNVEVVELIRGSFYVRNNLHDARYANYTLAREKGESVPLIRRFGGELTIKIKAKTYYDLWNTAAVIANCKLEFIRGTNDELSVTLDNFRLPTANDPTNLDGINEITLPFFADSISSVVAKDQISAY